MLKYTNVLQLERTSSIKDNNKYQDDNQLTTSNRYLQFQQETIPIATYKGSMSSRILKACSFNNISKKSQIFLFTAAFSLVAIVIIMLVRLYLSRYNEYYDLVRLDQSTGGLCLDGTLGSYYLSRHGDEKKIILIFQSGGWCGVQVNRDTINDCYTRSKTKGGTGQGQEEVTSYRKGALGLHIDNYFKDWKKVYLRYCDGAGHQGYRKDPVQYQGDKLYFRGHNITIGQLNSLQQKIGIFSKADQVIVSGQSAGGLAAIMWTNYISERVKTGKVLSMPDSGIFYDAQNFLQKRNSFKQSIARLMKLSNQQIDPPVPDCIQRYPQSKQNCMFSQHILQDIKVPIFIIQSLYDTWSLRFILGVEDLMSQFSSESQLHKQIQRNRQNITNLLIKVGESNPKNGYWGIGCPQHTFIGNDRIFDDQWRIPNGYQNSLMNQIQKWIEHSNVQKQQTYNNKHIDLEAWPSNKRCSGN